MRCGSRHLSTLATDAAGQLDVLGHDGHTLGVDGSQVGVLEQTHQVGLSSLLQGQDCTALEAQVGLEVLGNLTHQALEGQLADQQLSALLVLADLTQSHCSRAVPAGEDKDVRDIAHEEAQLLREVPQECTLPDSTICRSML